MIFQKGMPNQPNLVIGFWDMGPAEFEQACCRCGIQRFRETPSHIKRPTRFDGHELHQLPGAAGTKGRQKDVFWP